MNVRRTIVSVAALIAAVSVVTSAHGAANPYFGYDYLTVNNPTACSGSWGNGCAQGSFNNWDWSEISKNSGDLIGLGFRDSSGNFYYQTYGSYYNGTTFHITRTGVGAPQYNRPFCGYYFGGSSYAQCGSQLL